MLFAPINLQASTPMNTTVTTSSLALVQVYGLAIQAIYTGTTIAGAIKLQASVNNIDWADIADTSQTLSSAGNYVWNLNGTFYPHIRLVFTDAGSSSSDSRLVVVVYTKGF